MLNPTLSKDGDMVFDLQSFIFDPDTPHEKTIYHLRKAIIASCKKKGMSSRMAEDIATRNVDSTLEHMKQQLAAPASEGHSTVGATGTVIKGTPKTD